MDKSALQLLELLRSGLWGKAADPSVFEGSVDWSAIVSTAMDQTVALIVADGYATLPAQLQPPKKIQFNIEALRVRTAQAHQLLNHGLAEFSHLLDDNGIHHVLFKGQGLAQNYINPHSRTCGDIDLYVGEKNLDKAKAIMDDFGEADGKDFGFVDDEDIAFLQILANIRKTAIGQFTRGRAYQKTALVTDRRGVLGDESFGKVVCVTRFFIIKIVVCSVHKK